MDDFDYKKYSLEKLETWMRDALTAAEATPNEIYDIIRGVVEEEYHYFKYQTGRCNDLLALLGGTNNLQEQVKSQGDVWDKEDIEAILAEREYYEPSMPPWGHSDLEYGVNQDKILSCDKDDPSPECQKSWNSFWEDVDEKHSREYNLREAEYYNQRAKLDAEYEAIKAAGGYEWTPEPPKDKVVKWQLPVQQNEEDYFVEFPNDLLEAANLKEGDTVEWVDNGDGSYLLKKV